ncbi:MAG: hypothetical protein QOG20_6857 [Pseudonocardiales bacterium]|jgi:hypothetical protein|nr:hypothetical protein [Pseudonocardiales bacterium]
MMTWHPSELPSRVARDSPAADIQPATLSARAVSGSAVCGPELCPKPGRSSAYTRSVDISRTSVGTM